MLRNKIVDCGWGKLIFAQTFPKEKKLYESLIDEIENTRNIMFYADSPQVLTSKHPQELFIDPSFTYRKQLSSKDSLKFDFPKQLVIQEAVFPKDLQDINAIYVAQQALPLPIGFKPDKSMKMFVALEKKTQQMVGVCMWIDHQKLFNDPEKGSSFWALAVFPTTTLPGIGQALVSKCIEVSHLNGNAFLDLSVMHSNYQAIALYEKLGFERTMLLALKNKNKINEKLFIEPPKDLKLNMRSKVIIEGARRRGIVTDIIDEKGFFTLSFGGKSITCYESLTDFTSAISLKYCDNYRLTNLVLKKEGFSVPAQEEYISYSQSENFLKEHENIVVKVLKGSKYVGTTVDIKTLVELKYGIERAKKHGSRILLEKSVSGDRFRFLIINFKVVSILRILKPYIIGTGKHSIRKLLQKINRRQSTQYDDMHMPIDKELRSCIREYGYDLESIPKVDEKIMLRRYANEKKGEFLQAIKKNDMSSKFMEIAQQAAEVFKTPIVSIEMKIQGKKGYIIQANERPSLTPPHENEVVDAFLDFLFPQTVSS
ncbi:GNAT family N-acetyltransferase [Candidatus Gracilibacteria bacterium]|nr:GNAT family N-acetyltransferase [Candidatus Gracilibacteria bacterium]